MYYVDLFPNKDIKLNLRKSQKLLYENVSLQ